MTVIENLDGLPRPNVPILGTVVDFYMEERALQEEAREQEIFDSESLRIAALDRFSLDTSPLDSSFPRSSRSVQTDEFGTIIINVVSKDPQNEPVTVNFSHSGKRIWLSLLRDIPPTALLKQKDIPEQVSVSHEILVRLTDSIVAPQSVQA